MCEQTPSYREAVAVVVIRVAPVRTGLNIDRTSRILRRMLLVNRLPGNLSFGVMS